VNDASDAETLHAVAFPMGEAWSETVIRNVLKDPANIGWGYFDGRHVMALLLAQIVLDTAEILTIAVDPSARRQGYGALLVQHLTNYARSNGAKRLLLDVARDNEAAKQFYETVGFVQDGIRKGYYLRKSGQRVDGVLMSWNIAQTGG